MSETYKGVALATEVSLWSLYLDQFLQDVSINRPSRHRFADWSVNLDAVPDLKSIPELRIDQYQHHANQHRMLGVTLAEREPGHGGPNRRCDLHPDVVNDDCVGAYEDKELCRWHIQVNEGSLALNMAAQDDDAITTTVELVKKLFPEYTPSSPNVIPMAVWASAPQGPVRYNREIEVPTWRDIADNYNAETRNGLGELMDPGWRPSSGGQLLLWQGPPGTGKTYALRALGRQWKSWCELHYITDPDMLFGGIPAYLLRVVMDEGEDMDEGFDVPESVESESNRGRDGLSKPVVEKKWRLLVLEDSEELLQVDAKQNVGQALSRLLNLVDGLLGQGTRTLVLVTANQELGQLHPAISRPGRTAAIVKFNPLDGGEAHGWRTREGIEVGEGHPAGSATLAELFEQRDHKRILTVETKRSIGFSR